MRRAFLDPEKLLAAAQPNQEQLEYARQLRTRQEAAHTIFTCTAKSLAELVGSEKQATELAKKCKRDLGVQSQYLRVKKPVQVFFDIDLTEGEPPSEELFVRLGSDFNPLPESPLQVLGHDIPAEQLQTDHFLIHNMDLLSYSHDAPFMLMVSSNLHLYALDMQKMADELEQHQKYLKQDVVLASFKELPDPKRAFICLNAGPIALNEFPPNVSKLLRAKYYLEPPTATTLDALSPETLDNGIYYFTAAHPQHNRPTEFGCFSYAHILAVHAATKNVWQKYNILVKPHSTHRANDTTIFVADRPTIQLLKESLLRDMPVRAPRCPTNGLTFGIRRVASTYTGWLYTAQVFPKTLTSDDLRRKYRVQLELELDYSLAPKSIGRHALLVNGAQTTGFSNVKQHEAHCKELAQFAAVQETKPPEAAADTMDTQ